MQTTPSASTICEVGGISRVRSSHLLGERARRILVITYISLRVDFHLWHGVVELHVLLRDVSAVLDGFDAFAEFV